MLTFTKPKQIAKIIFLFFIVDNKMNFDKFEFKGSKVNVSENQC